MNEIEHAGWWQPPVPPTSRELWEDNKAVIKAGLIVMAVLVVVGGYHMGPLLLVPLGLAAYFAPSIVATVRRVRNPGSVLVVNLFLGWTFIGWVVALALAARSVDGER